MREEHEVLILTSPMPFNAEVGLEAYIAVMEAEDILPKQYVLYINTTEGKELEKQIDINITSLEQMKKNRLNGRTYNSNN